MAEQLLPSHLPARWIRSESRSSYLGRVPCSDRLRQAAESSGQTVRRGQRSDAESLFKDVRVQSYDPPTDAAMIERYVDGRRVKHAQRTARSSISVEAMVSHFMTLAHI